ncbi:uncharacterized protein LACBIDRAFT_328717 [Laccaria bicolor S238N-H82]|uniref:Predicted protein n=1 Tax=Laccaria bicolor (strain S238N-H82 / ATCC MYA-4686) TaxID=486041 RepID=B0DFS7_LACBS|nr:uncharacterized protein LACBIDRAFT_328717 [Laccaria bicolor S238N-H82]EDR06514.1 predicted protein [Laccaria bicolor S238N-H82]|eukprot:XP_001882886.1 predicted protein [Laccaria bicolor S238N-H82]
MATTIDDTDSSIGYSSGWALLQGSTRQWNGTVHSTSTVGATATFSFRGTGVAVYGTLPAGPSTAATQSQYAIDSGVPVNVSIASQTDAVYADLFFLSPLLTDGLHTLVITNEGTSVEYQLDRIDYNASVNVPVTVSGSSGSSISKTVSTTSSVSHSAAATSPAASSAKSAPVGTIVGSIAAGLLVVLIALLIYFNCRRRKPNAPTTDSETTATPTSWARLGQSITPFNLNDQTTQINGAGPIVNAAASQSSLARHTGFTSPILDSKSAGISPTSPQTHSSSTSPHMSTDPSNTTHPSSQGDSVVHGHAPVDTTAMPLPPIPVLEPPPAYRGQES